MQKFFNGIFRFQEEYYPANKQLFQTLASGQSPEVLFITCADSRVVPSLITQSKPGDLFICRNAGNIVPTYGEAMGGVSATIEYAVMALGVKHIVICGHSDCGAMKGVLYPEKVKHLPIVAAWLGCGETARRVVLENYPGLPEARQLELITQGNVLAQLDNLRSHPSVAARLTGGELKLHGWIYHIESGHVDAYDAREGRFIRLTKDLARMPDATPPARLRAAEVA